MGKERELEGMVVTHTVKACKKGEERHDLHSQIQTLGAWKLEELKLRNRHNKEE